MWSFEDERIDRAFQFRMNQGITDFTYAFRIIYSESDGLPGLIVDKYDNVLVCQFLSAGVEYFKEEKFGPVAIYERSDSSSRTREGLSVASGILKGKLPEGFIIVHENGSKFLEDVIHGHKTGFYLNQRDNRQIVKKMSKGMDVLNCFSYTGGFGISALLGGAGSVTNIDSSVPMLDLAKKKCRAEWIQGASNNPHQWRCF